MLRTLALLLFLSLAAAARASTTIAEIARIQGQGESVLQGLGLVMGLNGTGDSGKDLAMARPLAEMLKNTGNPVLLEELKNVKTVALVMVTCRIPESGARTDDRVDVTVSAIHSATSLAGGVLYIAPLTGPFPKLDSRVFAVAEGQVLVENQQSPRVGRVRAGAKIVRDIRTGEVGESFHIVLRPSFGGWAAASHVAMQITQELYLKPGRAQGGLPQIATVVDDRTVRVDIPPVELGNKAGFVGEVMATEVNISLMKLPAQVIYNQQSGVIILTGNVEISPVAITQRDLTITTTIPAPEPTPDNPVVDTRRWAALGTAVKNGDKAKLQDLLDALNQLRIPVDEQIAILSMLEKTGKLHARLIID
jgi:flagellar P-ring protein precursor FlgI